MPSQGGISSEGSEAIFENQCCLVAVAFLITRVAVLSGPDILVNAVDDVTQLAANLKIVVNIINGIQG